MNEIKVIGITGNMGSGKSTASNYIESKSYKVLYSDNIAKELLESNSDIKAKITNAFGNMAYINGVYNTKFISECVFGNDKNKKDNLEKLNLIIHPAVIEELINQIEINANNGLEIIFVESALIFELGLNEGFDYVINIYSNDNISIERITKRNNISAEEAAQRLKTQLSAEEKRKLADFTIINESTLEDLYKSIDRVLLYIL